MYINTRITLRKAFKCFFALKNLLMSGWKNISKAIKHFASSYFTHGEFSERKDVTIQLLLGTKYASFPWRSTFKIKNKRYELYLLFIYGKREGACLSEIKRFQEAQYEKSPSFA